ncbi:NYN domain-containing protein [Fontisphaera persica]|uniref:NYN domain-containing protein n=1 Tax=Fontisphaera persica TaxID=2974023 RepID=UPI0024C01029|nr:NYN domain-containing protein [Fontisphaera persica]WCJ60516.1 NYN domain-containing protein [Fontisphaera persica]
MKKVALLIDGGWFTKVLRKELSETVSNGHARRPTVTAEVVRKNALLALNPEEEEPWRIFYYDAYPYDGMVTNPVDGKSADFGTSPTNAYATKLFKELGQMDLVALRRGVLKPRGWLLTESFVRKALAAAQEGSAVPALEPEDVTFALEQKGVDIRVGLDVATLAIKRLVDRILIFSGDTDIVPAMKMARREGLQVAVVEVGGTRLSGELVEDADFLRHIEPVM